HFASAARLPEDRHGVWIAAKFGDVRTQPLERLNNVQHARVPGSREIRAEFAQVGKAENIETMIDGHDDHIAAPREIRSVVIGRRSRSTREASAVAPEHHWTFTASAHGWRPDIQHQTILALGRQTFA